jgi:hypothetical protein
MSYLGDFLSGSVIQGTFNSRLSTGVPASLANSPALVVYKDNGTTESTSGVSSIVVDFDSRIGLHYYTIDTSVNPSFYSSGADFRIVLSSGTIGGIDVSGVVVGTFSLENRSFKVVSSKLASLIEADPVSGWRFTQQALEQGPGSTPILTISPEAFLNLDEDLLKNNVFVYFNLETRLYTISLVNGTFDGQPMVFILNDDKNQTVFSQSNLVSTTSTVTINVTTPTVLPEKCGSWALRRMSDGFVYISGPAKQRIAAYMNVPTP